MWLLGHLIKAAFRAFFRILFAILFCGVVAGGVCLLVAYEATHQWPPSRLTLAAAIPLALLAAYAGGLTVLVKEAVRGVRAAEHDVEHGAEAAERAIT